MAINANIPAAPLAGQFDVVGFGGGKMSVAVTVQPGDEVVTLEGAYPQDVADALYRHAFKVTGGHASEVHWGVRILDTVADTDDVRVFVSQIARHLRDLARASELIAEAGLIETLT